MEWSFRYSGPIGRVDDRYCALCTAVATKRCRDHGAPTEGCTKCQAASNGECPSHCGLATALKNHEAILHQTDHGNTRWRTVSRQEGRVLDQDLVVVGGPSIPAGTVVGGDIGRRQERKQDAPLDERALAAFRAAGALALAAFGAVDQPDTLVEVEMRGDADRPMSNPLNLSVELRQL